MSDPKKQFADLIEAYAAARSTGNQILIEGSLAGLQQMFSRVTIEDEDQVSAEPSVVETLE